MTTTKQPKTSTKQTDPLTVKQIRVWKVFLLSLITFGLYAFIWLYKRSHELAEPRQKTPHWIWLISILSTFVIALIYIMLTAYTTEEPRQGAELIVYGTRVIGLVMTAALVWWMTRHAIAIAKAERIPISNIAITATALFFPPLLIALLQYSINRPVSVRETLASLMQKASILVIIIGIISTGLSISQNPLGPELEQTTNDISTLQEKHKTYTSCLKEKGAEHVEACSKHLR